MKDNTKYNISILVGGRSTEYDASLMSYLNVVEQCSMPKSKVEISSVIFIKTDFVYLHNSKAPKNLGDLTKKGKKYHISLLPSILRKNKSYILNLLHGNEGEDGSYQGLADIFNLQGTFGTVLASAITMNKWQSAEMVKTISHNYLSLIPYLAIKKDTSNKEIKNFLMKIKSDFFVLKPNSLGASLFTYKVKKSELISFLSLNKSIFDYDDTFLIQKYIKGREFTIGIVEKNNKELVLPILEAVTESKFLGHREKHNPGYITAAVNSLDDKLLKQIGDACKNIFSKLGIKNFARFDVILVNNKIYFLEINTIPGLMKQSSFTYMLSLSNITIPDLITGFVQNSLSSKQKQKKFRYTIKS